MRKFWLAACLLGVGGGLQATTISATAVFDSNSITPGVFGGWSITYSTALPGVKLTSVTFDLAPPGLFLDTNILTAPGALLALDFSFLTGGASTGFTGLTTPGTRDGSTAYTLSFTDFTSGESFGYELDVDQCSINDISDPIGALNCSLVDGKEFAGAKITFVFTTPDGTLSTTSAFVEKLDTAQPYDAVATGEIPEPATWTLLASAFALGVALRLRKS